MRFGRRAAAWVAVGVSLLAAGCSSPDPAPAADSDKPHVLTTFTVLADIARNVGGDLVEVGSIVRPGAEIHGYEPTPSEVAAASQADLVLENGMGLEAWFAQFIRSADVPSVLVTEGIDPIDITEDAGAGMANPHAWMSPVQAEVYIDNIAVAFGELVPEHADEFLANAAEYKEQVRQVHDSMLERLEQVPVSQRALVTCEGAFAYLARDAGLTEHYLWAVNAERQATPRQIASVIDAVRNAQIPAVFCESTVSDAAMQQVVSSTDARFGGVLYVDSLSEADGPVPTYLELLTHDANVIVAGLTGEGE